MTKWSKEQLRAIKETGGSLLVSAAAGSGKTATLSERCAYLVCEGALCDINQLLVVTFTEEAAAEMKARVGKALRQRLETHSSPRVKRQLALLPGAQISTIHAFCARLIKQHFQAVQLDPAFAVLDEQEAALLQRETADELFEENFVADSATFTGLIDLYADGKDERIEDQVIRTYNVLSSLVDAEAWRAKAIERLREVERLPDFFASAIGREFVAMARSRVAALIRHAESVLQALKGNSAAAGCDTVVEGVRDGLKALADLLPHQWAEARAMLAAGITPDLARAPNCDERERAKALMETVRKPVKGDLCEMFARDAEQLRAEVIKTIAPAECFLDLVGEFTRRYAEAKRRENVVDFSDLEHLALKVLEDPAIARQYQQRFASIMIDEFQDVNALQWELIRRVAREDENGEPCNLFCVGDVKQSIYRFRLADPSIFQARDEQWRPRQQVVDMRHNFRSRTPLLDSINFIFRDLMKKESAEIEYDHSQELDGKRDFPPGAGAFPGSPIELHLLMEDAADEEQEVGAEEEEEFTRVQKEAEYTARLIEELLVSGKNVTLRDGSQRPLQYGDIAVLLRSAKFTIVEYSRAIAAKQIPVFAESRTGFFQASEINDMLSILRLLDNQQQDIPMAAVLRGQILRIPQAATALARIRIAYRGLPFHAAVIAYAREKKDELAGQLGEILATLQRWRERALLVSVSDLIWEIFTQANYVPFCRGLEAGPQRVANLMYLHRCARRFSGFKLQGLYRFLQYIEQLQKESDLGQPSPGEPGNAVRVMTVHASKGLEFPVVILSDMNAKWNMRDGAGAILVNREQYLSVAVADPVNDIRYPSVASWLAKDRIHRASLAEELRVLYVAMTRAQEHLVMIGTCSEKQLESWQELPSPGVDPIAFSGAGSMLQWIVPLVPMGRGQIAITKIPSLEEQPKKQLPELADVPAGADESTLWTFAYPHAALTRHRASTSVTGLSKGDETPQPTPDTSSDEPSTGGEEAKQRGIAVHLFMEHLDFSTADPAGQLADMVERGVITPAQAATVDTADVQWLLEQSPLAAMLRSGATSMAREIPMLDSVPPEGVATTSELDRVLLRGRIDAVLPTSAGLVVIDYKTDRNYPPPGSRTERAYHEQMRLYREAIERSGIGSVSGINLVFLRARRVMEL